MPTDVSSSSPSSRFLHRTLKLALILVAAVLAGASRGAVEPENPPSALFGPVFSSDFESGGLCPWSTFVPFCADNNVCTDDVCDMASGECAFPNNAADCPLPHASGACAGGSCHISACNAGYSNCDGIVSNGCEVDHAAVVGSCVPVDNVGTFEGDTRCGPFCPGNTIWNLFGARTGKSSAWFRARVREASSCPTSIQHRIRLSVPDGVDFDLYIYRSCGVPVSSSTGSAGVDEEIIITQTENNASDDSFDYYVEVRFTAGASCTPWSLTFEGHDCVEV